MRLQILTILLFASITSFGQKKDSLEFAVYFTGCFKADTLSLTLNGVNIFKDQVITSDLSDEVAGYVFQNRIALCYGSKIKLPKVQIRKTNTLDFVINNVSEKFGISLKNGKYLLVDKCHGKGDFHGWRALSISQMKTAPVFD